MHADASNERIHRKVVWGGRARVAMVLLCTIFVPSCSDAIRTGQSSSYLILTSLQGSKGGGANSGTLGTSLNSDVITLVPALTGSPTVFGDSGQASFQLQMKDTLDSPTAVNAITLTQYHVKYIRSDGRNVQGVDVPYEFDGGMSFTVAGTGSVGFTLVRNQAKTEAPLSVLVNNAAVISTIAEVTFYGHDQTGRDVTVSGRIDVNFANWGD
jgi:hypothetical protein